LLPLAGGMAAYFAFSKLAGEGSAQQIEPAARLYVYNESELFMGKPAYYRIIVEDRQWREAEHRLKVKLGDEELLDQQLALDKNGIFNQTISFTPVIAGDYLKLEFLLLKNNEPFRTRVFQVSPALDMDIAPSYTVSPPELQNGDMEKDENWKFIGRDYSGNYVKSEFSSWQRSFQVKAQKSVKPGSYGSIKMEFPNDKDGFVSLSFDVKSIEASGNLQAIVNGRLVWENISGNDWKTIHVPVLLKRSNTLEFKVIAMNNTSSGMTAWWDNVKFEDYSPGTSEELLNYRLQKNTTRALYRFNSGDMLELNISQPIIATGGAVYSTGMKGNNIIFIGEKHEKMLASTASILIPIILELNDLRLKINETISFNNGYQITLKNISKQGLELTVSNNNTTVRNILSKGNSSIEYWIAPDGYKREKVLKLSSIKIYPQEITFDITQYDNKKDFFVGKKYEDFQVTQISKNSLIMKNIKPLTIEAGQELSLMNNSIKIKV